MRHLPGTVRQELPDGSVAVYVNHANVLLDHAVRLQGAVDEVKGWLASDDPAATIHDSRCGEGNGSTACDCHVSVIADVLSRWGV